MRNNDKLKPCPFCGCDNAGAQWHHGYWSITCGYNDTFPAFRDYCFQPWGEFATKDDAIHAWNRRALEQSVGKQKVKLRKCKGMIDWKRN